MEKFKGTKGYWKHSTIASEKLEGVTYSKIFNANRVKVIGRVNTTHKEEGHQNLKLITKAPELLQALNELILKLDKINYLLPRDDDSIRDKIQRGRNVVKYIIND